MLQFNLFGSTVTVNSKRTLYRSDNKPYMIQHRLIACKLFSIRLHTFVGSDEACPHNHPWAFFSLILRGSYREQSYRMINDKFTLVRSYDARKGDILFRKANHIHRVECDSNAPCKTLVVTFRASREWGFFNTLGHFITHNLYKHKEHCN